MTANPLTDPDYLPFKLDLAGRRLLLLHLTAAQRAEAAFLDERVLPPQPQALWCPLSMLPSAIAQPAPLDFIFHVGHCGSTLLSRLLQTWPALQVLREPLPLRTLAAAERHDDVVLRQLLSLWARPQAPAARTLIKATSTCNGLIAPILDANPHGRAILLDMPLSAYLATILKSEASLADVRAAAAGRLQMLVETTGASLSLASMRPAQVCAMGWLAERIRFGALAAGPFARRVLRVDFEQLLSRPAHVLAAIAAHLQLDPAGIDAALAAPAWRQYSKATAHRYDRQDRDHDLALAWQRCAPQIEEGLQWAEAFVQRHPACAPALPPQH